MAKALTCLQSSLTPPLWRAGLDGKEKSQEGSLLFFSLRITPFSRRRARHLSTSGDESLPL